MSTSSILINGLRLLGRHGALPGEQQRAQPFEVDITIEADIEPAARTDDLALTVDYGEVIVSVARIVQETSFSLLEALAGAIADDVLTRPGVEAVTVEVRKLHPPVAFHLESVGVRLRRSAA